MYDTTRHSLECWFKHEFEHLGWMVLAKSKSIDEKRSEQERDHMRNKVNVYCESIKSLENALEQKIEMLKNLKNEVNNADIEDLLVLHKNTKMLAMFVNSTLMNSSQFGGAKRRSKKSKKVSRK